MKIRLTLAGWLLLLHASGQTFSFPSTPDARTSLAFYYDDKAVDARMTNFNTGVSVQFAGGKALFFTPASITIWDVGTGKQMNQLTLDRLRKSIRGFPHFVSFSEGIPSGKVVFQPDFIHSNIPFVTSTLTDTLINFDPDSYSNGYMEALDGRSFHFWHKAGEQMRDYFYDALDNRFYYQQHEWARPFSFVHFQNGGRYRYDELNKKEPTAIHLFSTETKAGGDIYFADLTLVIYDMELNFYVNESRWLSRSPDGSGNFRGTTLPSLDPISLPHTKKKGYFLWNSAFEFPYVWLTYGSYDDAAEKGSDIHFVEVNLLTHAIERHRSVSDKVFIEEENERVFGYRNVWHMLAVLHADSLRKPLQPSMQSLRVGSAEGQDLYESTPSNYYGLKKAMRGNVTVTTTAGRSYTLALTPDQALLSVAVDQEGKRMAVVIGKKALSTSLKNTNRRFYFYDTYYYLADLGTGIVTPLTDKSKYEEQMNLLKSSYKPSGKYFDPFRVN